MFRWSVLVWAFLLFFSSIAIVITEPGIVITAETLGIEVPYAWFILPLDTLFVVITLTWFLRERRNLKQQKQQKLDPPKWAKTNTIFLILAVMLIPLEYLFFNAGELHGPMDQVAVALTFIQYIMINLSLYPWKQKHQIPQIPSVNRQ